MKLPTPATPGAAARRSLLADVIAALVIAALAIALAAGIGVVGFLALLTALLLLPWYLVEAVVRLVRRRRLSPARGARGARPAAATRPGSAPRRRRPL